jgi:hypothetical protein
VTPATPCSEKPGPMLSLGDESPSGENRGGTPAGERARQRTGRRKPTCPWRAAVPAGTASRNTAPAGVPLPLFAGSESKRSVSSSPDLFRRSRLLWHGIATVIGMPWTSPGMTRSLFERVDRKNSRARMRRGTECALPSPGLEGKGAKEAIAALRGGGNFGKVRADLRPPLRHCMRGAFLAGGL